MHLAKRDWEDENNETTSNTSYSLQNRNTTLLNHINNICLIVDSHTSFIPDENSRQCNDEDTI